MPGFYRDSLGRVIGPISSAELKKLAATNVITRDTMIAPKQEGPWVNAGRVRGLFASLDEVVSPALTGDGQTRVVSRAGEQTGGSMSRPGALQPHKSAKASFPLLDKVPPQSMSSLSPALLIGTAAGLLGVLVGGAIVLALTSSRSQAVSPAQQHATASSQPIAASTASGRSEPGDGRTKPQKLVAQNGTNSIETLTVEQAQRLALQESDLILDGITTLSPEAAEPFADHKKDLSLGGLKTISLEVALALAEHQGHKLCLDGLAELSPEVADALARYKGSLSLGGIAVISPEVARALAKHEDFLCIDGLSFLLPQVATELAKHQGRGLKLAGLVSLPDETALQLAEYRGSLNLNGLTTLSAAGVGALTQRPRSLCLDGLTTLSDEVLSALSQHEVLRGAELSLNGLTVLSPAAARALAKSGDASKQSFLKLNGLTALSPEAAQALARHTGPLQLGGLTTLSPEAAYALAGHEYSLNINGMAFSRLATLSLEAANALAAREVDFSFNLVGLTTLSPEAAVALAQRKGDLYLNELTVLSDGAAQALGKHDGSLSLNGLRTLSDEAATALSQHSGGLNLDGVITLSGKAAQALAESYGVLSLKGLQAPSDEVIEALSRHKDWLVLDGLTTLSSEGARALAAHSGGELSLDGVKMLSEEGAASLAEHKDNLSLSGLTTLTSVALAARLADHWPGLYLNGLATVSDEVVAVLARHNGDLHLNGLAAISDTAASVLAQHRRRLTLNSVKTLSDKAAAELAQHADGLELKGLAELSEEAMASLNANPKVELPKTLSRRDALVGKQASRRLEDNVIRVARGSATDPGWAMQAVHRGMRASGLDEESPLGCMLDAYQRGVGEWRNPDGTTQGMSSVGLPGCDWRSVKHMPSADGPDSDAEPTIVVKREENGSRATLAPTAIAEDLFCSVSFLVIDNTPEHARAAGLDFLAVQVELYGGKPFEYSTSPIVEFDTYVDFWSSKKKKRYTITRWQASEPLGHMTVQTYGPLLFEVLNNDPDFMFVENVKIALSRRFRAGCRELCDKVMQLRDEQGQTNPPVCRKP